MASIRDLKKDVKYLVNHFMDECYTQLAFSPTLDQENTIDIISDALELRDDIITKLNKTPEKGTGVSRYNYYNSIAEEFYNRIIELTERLHSLEY
ncbi:MAG: hypothetical protein AB9846_10935 [Tenuifilaceae bacterium]